MIRIVTLMSLCFALAWAEPETHTLEFFKAPEPGWSKNRLAGRLLSDNSGFEIFDMSPEAAPFDDAETFKVESALTLPFGKKRMTVTVNVAETIEPLWENRLMQFQLNGKELDVGLNDDGQASFTKEFGDDGKGFVPAESGTYHFTIPKDMTDIQFISFMTAGASKFQMTVTEVVIETWPEEDLRPRPYLLRYNRLGYLVNQPQPVVMEWQDDLEAKSLPLTIRQSASAEQKKTLIRGALDPHVGLDTTPLDLQLTQADYTTLVIPETVKRTKHASHLIRSRTDLSEYKKQRDLALGGFHWFDMRTYPKAHHQDKQASLFKEPETKIDVYGGWYDAGDYGRYSVNGAWSAHLILLSYAMDSTAFPDDIKPLTREDSERAAVLDLVLPELLFLLKMQRDDGAVYHKVNSRDWPSLTLTPEDDLDEKFVMPISTTATANVAAVMNLAAKIFSETGREADFLLAEKFKTAAKKSQQFLKNNPQLIMIQDKYDGYEYGGPYSDQQDRDERLLAHVSQLWNGESLASDTKNQLLGIAQQLRFSDASPDWMHVNFLSVFTALVASDDIEFKTVLLERVEKEFRTQVENQKNHAYGLLYAGDKDQFNWGSNGIIATLGLELLWLHQLTGDTTYWNSAYLMSHWFFGLNPHGLIFTTGASKHNAAHPHFRPMVSQAAPKAYGLLVGGPNSVELKGDPAAAPKFEMAPMQVYIDHQDSWATNEVAINWQAAWASYLTLLVR